MIYQEVGNLTQIYPQLRNTYFQTSSGLLVPSPISFFTDSGTHIITNIHSIVINNQLCDDSTEFEEIRILANPEAHDKDVLRAQKVIDEILMICDPEKSFNITEDQYNLQGKGIYADDTKSFFNSDKLRQLYEKVSVQHYDYKKREATEENKKFNEFWNRLEQRYLTYFASVQVDISPELKQFLQDH